MKLSDRLVAYFFANPIAWFLLALLLVALHGSYQRGKELDLVCEAIDIPDLLPSKPKTTLEKAQAICEERGEPPELSEE